MRASFSIASAVFYPDDLSVVHQALAAVAARHPISVDEEELIAQMLLLFHHRGMRHRDKLIDMGVCAVEHLRKNQPPAFAPNAVHPDRTD